MLDDEYRRRFLALEGPRRRQGRVSLVRGSALDNGYPVLAEQGDAGAGQRLPTGDRMHEHVMAAVRIGFDQQADVANQHEAPVRVTDRLLPGPIPSLHGDDIKAAVRQVVAEVHTRIGDPARMFRVEVDKSRRARRDVVFVESVAIEVRAADVASGLAGEVMDVPVEEASQLDAQRLHAARDEAQALRARQWQHSAGLRDLGLARVVGRPCHRVVGPGEDKTTVGFQPRVDLQVEVAALWQVEGGAVPRRRIAFDRGQAQIEALGFAQHRRRYLARRLPRVVGLRGVFDNLVRGQQIGADAPLQGIAAHAIAELNAQGLHLVLVVVPGRQRVDLRDAEVGTEVGDAQVPRQCVREPRGAAGGLDTAAHLQAHELFTRRQVDRRGMDVGPPAQRAVANVEVDALPERLDRRIGLAQPVLHTPLQGCPLDGMGEVEGGDDLAQAALHGTRIKLEGADAGAEVNGLELRCVRFEF